MNGKLKSGLKATEFYAFAAAILHWWFTGDSGQLSLPELSAGAEQVREVIWQNAAQQEKGTIGYYLVGLYMVIRGALKGIQLWKEAPNGNAGSDKPAVAE